MKISFFLPMKTIPTVTSQEKGVNFSAHRIFTKPEVLDVKKEYISLLVPNRPKRPMRGPLKLTVVWCFPPQDRAPAGTYKATKPDTDNMIKLLKDCMTELSFWMDDAQVAVEHLSKGYDDPSGIFIEVHELEVIECDADTSER